MDHSYFAGGTVKRCIHLILLLLFAGYPWCAVMAADPPQKWAVVIGVGDYQDQGISKLPLAVKDARAMADMLISMPEGFPKSNVMLLADTEGPERQPTRSNMIRYLSSWLSLAGPEDTVLVYFAGHGTTENEALYLLPSDTSLADVAQTGYAFASMEQLLKKIPAKKKVLIMDACHSGTGRSIETMSADAMRELERASQGMVTLASCSGSEKSYEMPDAQHGAFTYFLMEALSGKADKDGDGYVSASEASVYTWDNTRRWASERGLQQTPWRREEAAGEIMLAQTGGALPSADALQQPLHTPAPPQSGAKAGNDIAKQFTGRWAYEDPVGFYLEIGREEDHFTINQITPPVRGVASTMSYSDIKFDGTRLSFVEHGSATSKGLFGSTIITVFEYVCELIDNGTKLKVDCRCISTQGVNKSYIPQTQTFFLRRSQ